MTQSKLLAACFALMSVVGAAMFFIDGFPNYGHAVISVLSAVAAYLIFSRIYKERYAEEETD